MSLLDELEIDSEDRNILDNFFGIKQETSIVSLNEKIVDTIEPIKITQSIQQNSFFENEYIKEIFKERVGIIDDELDEDLFEIAKEEIDEHLDSINSILNDAENFSGSDETNKLKRILHTLKGSARMAGANKVGGIAHRLESLLDIMENHNIDIAEAKDILIEETDKITFLLENIHNSLPENKLHWLDTISLNGVEDIDFSTKEVEQDLSIQEEIKDVAFNFLEKENVLSILNNDFIKEIFKERVSLLTDEIDNDLFEVAKIEAEEQLETINSIVENSQDDVLISSLPNLKRVLHTLKGGARMAGANKVGGIAHRLESLLDFAENHNMNIGELKNIILTEVEKVSFLIKNKDIKLDELKLHWLDNSVIVSNKQEQTNVKNVQGKEEKQQFKAKTDLQFIRINSHVIDSLVTDTNEIRMTRNNLEDSVDNYKKRFSDIKAFAFKLEQILKEIEVQAESQIQAKKEQQQLEDLNFDPLEFDRFTRLQELTRFMAETVNDINDSVLSLESNLKHQEAVINSQGVIASNVVSQLMKVRLVPFDSVADRFYKITRNTAKELNKKAMLEIKGEQTEIDKIVLDKIISPLEHLLRNGLAHGIETPNERMLKNKNPIGKISIEVRLEGNFILIDLKDDGAGINVNKVKEIAISKGILQHGKEYSEKEIIDVIFAPGFSTADQVSQVAGRGVGMDVVKSEISSLGGSVSIQTFPNNGTLFSISLPVSLATSQSMLVEVGKSLVAIPNVFIDEVLSLKSNQLAEVYQKQRLERNGQSYPMHYLGHLLGGPLPQNMQPEIKNYNSLIVISYLNEKLVIHVDKILNSTEIIIKNVGPQFNKVVGVIGATKLGNGRQGLIVNPIMLKQHWEKHIINKIMSSATAIVDNITKEIKVNTQLTVMVVDDSLTVRKASTKTLERNGFKVLLAKDGEDALEKLQLQLPDIILSDIEMPTMDGFELLKNLKNSTRYKDIPVIMITSRTADKHKNHAMDLGASGFLGKPFQEDDLIENIKLLTNKQFTS